MRRRKFIWFDARWRDRGPRRWRLERDTQVARHALLRRLCPRDDRSPRLEVVVPLFYQQPDRFADMMRHAIALTGSFSNKQRMVMKYVQKVYFR